MPDKKNAAKKPQIFVIVYPLHEGETNAPFEEWTAVGKRPIVTNLQCNNRLDVSDRPDIVKKVFRGVYEHDIFVNGEKVPNAIMETEIEEDDGTFTTLRQAVYHGDTAITRGKRGPITEHEEELYDYIIHLIAKA